MADPTPAEMGRRAYACEVCGTDRPHWTITRRGDAVVTWSCDAHLAEVAHRLQRDWEVTELVVRSALKLREWHEIGRSLDDVAKGATDG